MAEEVKVCTLETERRENFCPIAEKAAERIAHKASMKAAQEAVNDLFLRFDYDIENKEDRRKIRRMLGYLDKMSEYTEAGKKRTFLMIVGGMSSVVAGILVLGALDYLKGVLK